MYITVILNAVKFFPVDFGLLPILRHLKLRLRISFLDNTTMLSFLIRLLSATNGIETLEIKIIWFYVVHGRGKDLFLPETGWSTLDETLALKNFDSLKKVVFISVLWMEGNIDHHSDSECSLECGGNETLPYFNALFPIFRAKRILETHLADYYSQ